MLKAYFEKVYPELDFDRVYASDMKKIIKWFGILSSNNIEIKAPEEETAEEGSGNDAGKQETTVEKPVPQDGSLK